VETISTYFLEDLPFEPDIPALMRRLRVKEGSQNALALAELVGQAANLARPKALVQEAFIAARGDDWIEIEGARFGSRVLQVNLDHAHRVFPYLATCGTELQGWAAGMEDLLLQFWAEAVMESALASALQGVMRFVEERFHPGKTAAMNPGSLADWPIQEQLPLFQLFGEHSGAIGVQLTDSFLMIPSKTVSGIRFPTEASFESCQLCPREDCPGRRAPYDAALYDKRFCPKC
jgi:hypothetical protein